MSSLLFPHPDRAANKSAVPKNTTICGLRTSWKRLPDLPPSQQGTPSRCLSRAKKVPLCCCGYKETKSVKQSHTALPILGLLPGRSAPNPGLDRLGKDAAAVSHAAAPVLGGLLTRTLPGMQLSECGRREGTMPPVRTPRCGAQRATVANSCCRTGPHPAMDGHA